MNRGNLKLIMTLATLTAGLAVHGVSADSPHPGPPAGFEETVVYRSGTDGYLFYRIPSVVVTKKGTVLAIAEARRSPWGPQNDSGEINVVVKRSSDNGKTFSDQKVIFADGPNTCGNPCAVVDQETGTIVLVMSHNDGLTNEDAIAKRESRAGRTVWVTTSDDDGVTWSTPRDITKQVKKDDWTWYATGPGIGIQLQRGEHKGRLVIPCNHSQPNDSTGTSFSHVIYSDDHGKTWQLGGQSPIGEGNESQIVERADGSLLLNMRNARGKSVPAPGKTRAIATSTDGGVTFTDFRRDEALIEPVCQGSILRYSWPDASQRSRIMFANPASTTERVNMTVRISYDEGQTWATSSLINKGWSCYSSLTGLPDGNVGLLYEAGSRARYETINFVRLSLEWLSNGKDSAGSQSEATPTMP